MGLLLVVLLLAAACKPPPKGCVQCKQATDMGH
jgi:hypothetical protein